MLFSINDLFGFNAAATDFTATVIDAFVDRDTMQIKYLAIDTGGLLSNNTVVIAADKVAKIDPDERSVMLAVTKADIEKLDVIDKAGLDDGLQLSDIPALLLGPSREKVAEVFLSQKANGGALFSARGVTDSITTYEGSETGKVIGLIAGLSDMTVSHLAIDTGVVLPETQRVLPVKCIEALGDSDTPTALTIDADTLAASPQLENTTAIDRHWVDKVASYYGLS